MSKLQEQISNKVNDSVESATVDLGVKIEKATASYEAQVLGLQAKIKRLQDFKADLIKRVESGEIKLASEVTSSTLQDLTPDPICHLISAAE